MIKVEDIAYVRLSAPDLDAMQRFATDFGLVVTKRDEEVLYARGTDPSPYVHVTQRGAAGFVGIAFEVASARDLAAAARLDGASAVEEIEAPGGGQRVRFSDPDGFEVEVVHGREPLPALEFSHAAPLNRGSERLRRGELQRLQAGPSPVKRLGHAGIHVSDYVRSREWYGSRFGLVASDEVYVGEETNVIAAFMRCDRGEVYTDHHTLVCLGVGEVGLDHVAFEVEDFDAVMLGHDHLKQSGYEHKNGVGRHVLGSQIYDYWLDPWGHMHEHFTDGDLLNDRHETQLNPPSIALGTQWGAMTP
jgi:catechol 2,3-dioxygenase-like lactoylglutathione lyase family enzyme